MPLKTMNQKQLWDKLAKENSRYYINSDLGRDITEEEFVESGENDYQEYIQFDPLIKPGGIFLEIGCGTGRMTEFIAKDFRVVATDISGEMIKRAQQRLPGIDFMETDGETIPLPDNSIDVAFSYLVFQHFKTKEMLVNNFKEVYRILKRGGLFKVRVRTDKIKNMESWWSGIDCDESIAEDTGFFLLQKERVGDYGLWLWLEK